MAGVNGSLPWWHQSLGLARSLASGVAASVSDVAGLSGVRRPNAHGHSDALSLDRTTFGWASMLGQDGTEGRLPPRPVEASEAELWSSLRRVTESLLSQDLTLVQPDETLTEEGSLSAHARSTAALVFRQALERQAVLAQRRDDGGSIEHSQGGAPWWQRLV